MKNVYIVAIAFIVLSAIASTITEVRYSKKKKYNTSKGFLVISTVLAVFESLLIITAFGTKDTIGLWLTILWALTIIGDTVFIYVIYIDEKPSCTVWPMVSMWINAAITAVTIFIARIS